MDLPTDLTSLSDAELCAAWERAAELVDEARMDRLSDEIERRGLDL